MSKSKKRKKKNVNNIKHKSPPPKTIKEKAQSYAKMQTSNSFINFLQKQYINHTDLNLIKERKIRRSFFLYWIISFIFTCIGISITFTTDPLTSKITGINQEMFFGGILFLSCSLIYLITNAIKSWNNIKKEHSVNFFKILRIPNYFFIVINIILIIDTFMWLPKS